ncbi:MAG: hypothetical protein CSB55_03475 [Candidatus Cloacimonadota bacterium]|nr:MAG: hypothetical protein CSB55_03475 [Candidatus Cloacimonadota bacterium]
MKFLNLIKFERLRSKSDDEWVLYKIDNNEYILIENYDDYDSLLMIDELIIAGFNNFSPGLYRLINSSRNINKQFFIKSDDIIRDIKNLMFMFVRGDTDSYKPDNVLYRQAMKRNLVMTCGCQADFVISLTEKFYMNVKMRKIYFLTCDKFNYYNDSHVAVEVFDDKVKKWILLDLMRNAVYKHANEKRYLSAYDIIKLKDLCRVEKLVRSAYFDNSFGRFNFKYAFFEELSYSEIGYKLFLNRIMQSLIIPVENRHYGYSPNSDCKNQINKLYKNTVFLDSEKFIKKFYGE